jgi:two-component system chemotaxis response regulator CheY
MKALVVESSSTMRSVLHRLLLVRGFEVSEADDSSNALDVLQQMGSADLVLLNLGLHEAESLEWIARLRHEVTRNTEIVILAEREPEARELHRALIAGADDYLVKPFTAKQIDEKLAKAGFNDHWVSPPDSQDQTCRY